MSIPVEFINPFFSAAMKVCNDTLKIAVTPGKPRLCAPTERIWKLFAVSAFIQLSGAVKGVVGISLSKQIALAMASGLASETFDELDANANDALGEVANLVIGVAKRDLPGGLVSITPPKVVATHEITFPVNVPILILPFETASGRFVLQVAIQPIGLRAAA